MDPLDHLLALPDGPQCSVCDERVPVERVRVLAWRDNLVFLQIDCGACLSTTLGFVLGGKEDGPVTGQPADPITSDDVLDMHQLLSTWRGDLTGLLAQADPGPARIGSVTGGRTEATGTPQPTQPPVPPETATESVAPAESDGAAVAETRFAHASEAEMARILDFYAVRWEYEPTTFPILWNLDGEVVESFAPDFYLPDLEVYLEMTTLKQRLVRKKNRKLRRLRELYPDIRIKLFYARDFRAMMLKYGRLGLAHSLSGTPGQVVPERAAIVPPIAAVEIDEATLPATAIVPPPPGVTAPAVPGPVAAVEPGPATGSGDRSIAPIGPRATPRSRPGRRRRRARNLTEAGADREAGS